MARPPKATANPTSLAGTAAKPTRAAKAPRVGAARKGVTARKKDASTGGKGGSGAGTKWSDIPD